MITSIDNTYMHYDLVQQNKARRTMPIKDAILIMNRYTKNPMAVPCKDIKCVTCIMQDGSRYTCEAMSDAPDDFILIYEQMRDYIATFPPDEIMEVVL